jgi:hypothetical protein
VLGNNRVLPGGTHMLLAELLAAFNDVAKVYYAPQGDSEKSEYGNFRSVIKLLNQLYGQAPIDSFGPNKLRVVVDEMAKRWVRNTVNAQLRRAKRIFKWGVSRELVPAAIYQAVTTVEGLHAGRSNARENPAVQPVGDEDVDRAIPFTEKRIAAMVQIQRQTGIRPGEVVRMRNSELHVMIGSTSSSSITGFGVSSICQPRAGNGLSHSVGRAPTHSSSALLMPTRSVARISPQHVRRPRTSGIGPGPTSAPTPGAGPVSDTRLTLIAKPFIAPASLRREANRLSCHQRQATRRLKPPIEHLGWQLGERRYAGIRTNCATPQGRGSGASMALTRRR